MFHLMQWCCFVHVSCKPTFHAAKRYIFISFHIMIYHFISFQNSRIVCMVSLSYFSLLNFDLTHQTTVQWEMASSVDGHLAVPGM